MDVFRGRSPECAISSNDISRWFGKRIRQTIGEAHCAQLAMSINGFCWPGDPAPIPGTPGYLDQENVDYEDRFHQLEKAALLARSLRNCLPFVIPVWEHQHCANQPDTALRNLINLFQALDVAMPRLEFPYGPIGHHRGKPRASKRWHTYSLIIGSSVKETMIMAGHRRISFARSSPVVRLVQEAMIRMKIEQAQTLSEGCISAFLMRWDRSYWLPSQQNSVLTTKTTSPDL